MYLIEFLYNKDTFVSYMLSLEKKSYSTSWDTTVIIWRQHIFSYYIEYISLLDAYIIIVLPNLFLFKDTNQVQSFSDTKEQKQWGEIARQAQH